MKIENGEGRRWKEHATLEGELPWISARRSHHLRKFLKIRPKGKERKWRRRSHTHSLNNAHDIFISFTKNLYFVFTMVFLFYNGSRVILRVKMIKRKLELTK